MGEPLDTEVPRAWERLRPFARRVDPEVPAEDRARAWAACVGRLAEVFAAHLGPDSAARFAVPAGYAGFMVAVGGGWAWGPEHREQVLWPAAAVTDETVRSFRRYVAERPTDAGFADDFPEPPDDGLWLGIGCIPGCKHDTLLCCDRRHDDYGCVIDHFDGHPWLNGSGSYGVVARSFAEWLAEQRHAEPDSLPSSGRS